MRVEIHLRRIALLQAYLFKKDGEINSKNENFKQNSFSKISVEHLFKELISSNAFFSFAIFYFSFYLNVALSLALYLFQNFEDIDFFTCYFVHDSKRDLLFFIHFTGKVHSLYPIVIFDLYLTSCSYNVHWGKSPNYWNLWHPSLIFTKLISPSWFKVHVFLFNLFSAFWKSFDIFGWIHVYCYSKYVYTNLQHLSFQIFFERNESLKKSETAFLIIYIFI